MNDDKFPTRKRESNFPHTDEIDEEDNFPVIAALKESYVLENFVPVTVKMDARETTESDLNILNNHLGLCHAVLPYIKDIDDLCKVSLTVTRLVQCRRAVKELPYGNKMDVRNVKMYEVIE